MAAEGLAQNIQWGLLHVVLRRRVLLMLAGHELLNSSSLAVQAPFRGSLSEGDGSGSFSHGAILVLAARPPDGAGLKSGLVADRVLLSIFCGVCYVLEALAVGGVRPGAERKACSQVPALAVDSERYSLVIVRLPFEASSAWRRVSSESRKASFHFGESPAHIESKLKLAQAGSFIRFPRPIAGQPALLVALNPENGLLKLIVRQLPLIHLALIADHDHLSRGL